MNTRRRIFVLTCGRTGTTALAHHARALLPHATVRHEPAFWLLLRRASVRYFTGRSSAARTRRVLSLLRWAERQRSSGAYLETTPALWGLTPLLPEVFPGCTLVHIVRDPCDYAMSAYRFGSHRHHKGRVLDLIPDFFPRPERIDPDVTWHAMTPIERSVWFWATVNGHIARNLEVYVGPKYFFRFEKIYGENADRDQIGRLAEALGVDDHERMFERLRGYPINTSSGGAQPTSLDRPGELEQAVARWATPVAERFGYSTRMCQ